MGPVKKILKTVCFIALFILCANGFRYLLIDDTESYTRLMMHEFYGQKNIDVLFVGSSHCYGSLDPKVTDEIFQMNTFNAGTALQALDASYALIREAADLYDVKQVYLEMYYLMMGNDDYQDREYLTETYIVADYMRPSLNKARFLLEASSPKYYVNSFLPARRNWEKLLHPSEVTALLNRKMSPAYRNYEPVNAYRSKGYIANQGAIKNGLLLDPAGFDRVDVSKKSEDWLRTLRDIISFCQKKGIRLTLFSAPMTLFQTAGLGNYDEYIAMIRDILRDSGFEYVDFNLCREAYFDQSADIFVDAGHMNETGAKEFSRVFADYFTGRIGKSELFYDSMAEKLAAAEPRILGISFLSSGDGMRKMKIVSSMPEGTAFEVRLINADGSSKVVKDNSREIFFELPQEEHGTMQILALGQTAEIEV